MGEHKIRLTWTDGGKPFTYEAYPREHQIAFKDGQDTMTASASPAYEGDGKHGDPEDMLVAALSSCHMLSLLAICAKKKITVQSYEDDAVGFLENDSSNGIGGNFASPASFCGPRWCAAPTRQPWNKSTIWRTKPASSPIP